jgi:hypothetical protein
MLLKVNLAHHPFHAFGDELPQALVGGGGGRGRVGGGGGGGMGGFLAGVRRGWH